MVSFSPPLLLPQVCCNIFLGEPDYIHPNEEVLSLRPMYLNAVTISPPFLGGCSIIRRFKCVQIFKENLNCCWFSLLYTGIILYLFGF